MIYFQIFTTFRYKSLKNSEYSDGMLLSMWNPSAILLAVNSE